jgi:hypothetical protein
LVLLFPALFSFTAQILLQEHLLRDTDDLQRKAVIATRLTELLNSSAAAGSEFFRGNLYDLLLDELYHLVPAVRFPREATASEPAASAPLDDHMNELAFALSAMGDGASVESERSVSPVSSFSASPISRT